MAALLCAFSFTTRAAITPPDDSQVAEQQSIQIVMPPEGEAKDDPFATVEVMPKFGDGDLTTFRSWVNQNLIYPVAALNADIQGRVVVSFVVECDGSISNIVPLQSPDVILSDEAVRVLKTSPKWTPGSVDNKAVRVKYTLPVDFMLTKSADHPQK